VGKLKKGKIRGKAMALDAVLEKIKQKLSQASGLKARVKFNFGDDGVIFVDTTVSPPVLSHEDQEADTTLSCSLQTFEKILEGAQDPNLAFMMGKLKIAGSMGLAMKLNSILED
jgi:putative sterol carrier protein